MSLKTWKVVRRNEIINFMSYLDIFGKLVVDKDAERSEITHRIEFKDDVDRLAVAPIFFPPDPAFLQRKMN